MVLLHSRTLLSCLTSSTEDSELPSFTPEEEVLWLGLSSVRGGSVCEGVGRPVWLNVAWGVQGERQSDGSVPPGPVLIVVGRISGGGAKVVPLRPSWLSSEPSSVSSSDESTS